MIIIFLGPPYCGKGTHAELLGKELNLPLFSIGQLIREACERQDPKALEGYEKYSMKGYHLPNRLKFYLLKEKMDSNKNGFILDNYPATQEDLNTFTEYILSNHMNVNKVIYLPISLKEMQRRMVNRNRKDDRPDIVLKRRIEQDKDRVPVIKYFKSKGLLVEINAEGSIEEVHSKIREAVR